MKKVISINGNSLPGEPNPRVVNLLEEALEKARNGEITAVAIATLDPSGCADSNWAHQAEFFSLIGAVAMLQYRLLKD